MHLPQAIFKILIWLSPHSGNLVNPKCLSTSEIVLFLQVLQIVSITKFCNGNPYQINEIRFSSILYETNLCSGSFSQFCQIISESTETRVETWHNWYFLKISIAASNARGSEIHQRSEASIKKLLAPHKPLLEVRYSDLEISCANTWKYIFRDF